MWAGGGSSPRRLAWAMSRAEPSTNSPSRVFWTGLFGRDAVLENTQNTRWPHDGGVHIYPLQYIA